MDKALIKFLTAYRKYSSVALGKEYVGLAGASNRVLFEDISSPLHIPPFTRSAMDGYAVVADDTKGASTRHPVSLDIVGSTSAGEPISHNVEHGKAVAIATGAKIPKGADAVVMVEQTAANGKRVEVFKEIVKGKNISVRGEDIQKGRMLFRRGTWLRPQDVGLLASVGISEVPVFRRPKVALLSTGTELVEPGSPLENEASLYESNRHMLSGMVQECGGEVEDFGICKDDKEAIEAALGRCLEHDLVVVSGGSSVGEKDFVPAAINNMGTPGVVVHGVAMRPGSPTALSVVRGKPVIAAPGYPVSAFCAFYTFGRPLLFDMLGTCGLPEGRITAKMTSGIKLHEGMRTFVRLKVKAAKDKKGSFRYLAEPVSASAASMLSTLTVSNGLAIADGEKRLFKGQNIEVITLGSIDNSD